MEQGDRNPSAQRKAVLLQSVRQNQPRRLSWVSCLTQPAWALELLQLAAPHLEALKVYQVRGDHLLAVHAMPVLGRLAVVGDRQLQAQASFPAELPPLPARHAGLRWLRVGWLPRETTLSLIRAHAGTLEELELVVGTPGGGDWPSGCEDLPAALGRCGLAGLRRLVLSRKYTSHDQQRCSAQLSAVRGALHGVQVQCASDTCDNVQLEF